MGEDTVAGHVWVVYRRDEENPRQLWPEAVYFSLAPALEHCKTLHGGRELMLFKKWRNGMKCVWPEESPT